MRFFTDLSATNQRAPWAENKLNHIIMVYYYLYLPWRNLLGSSALALSPNSPTKVFPRSKISIASCLLPSKKLFFIVLLTDTAPSRILLPNCEKNKYSFICHTVGQFTRKTNKQTWTNKQTNNLLILYLNVQAKCSSYPGSTFHSTRSCVCPANKVSVVSPHRLKTFNKSRDERRFLTKAEMRELRR